MRLAPRYTRYEELVATSSYEGQLLSSGYHSFPLAHHYCRFDPRDFFFFFFFFFFFLKVRLDTISRYHCILRSFSRCISCSSGSIALRFRSCRVTPSVSTRLDPLMVGGPVLSLDPRSLMLTTLRDASTSPVPPNPTALFDVWLTFASIWRATCAVRYS